MQLRYRYRLYPDESQRQAMAQAFGNARVVYNDAVRARQDAHAAGEKFPSGTVLQKWLITDAKHTDERGQDVELGLDLGLSAFAVDQHGRVINNPRFLRRAERKLKWAQRAVSRTQRGSNNRTKARRRLARQHAKVSDTRQDWLHKATTRLVRENQTIAVEDLAVSGLARTWLAKSVHDAGWGQFRRLLGEKCARYGRELVVIDRWWPTSQTCSDCGRIDGPESLGVRTWSCPCGAVHDRDINAARNILAAGRAERLNACGGDVRPHTGAVAAEAGSSGTPQGDAAPHPA
ncbi:transposase [Actinopolyspora erythraea]|uniref:Transposase n=1 Tax=Actinopolyspora erythraea TaxID=414996 RepID=A0A223RW26_9ACTN|nr:RNA-guided endonuclease TnpB family protein [Actinopolyspora erythraea]ASU80086.1 transposase [Actinopolyspora erythraea]